MKLPRRQFLHLAAGAAALPALSRVARAQAYPSRPVRIIAPLAGGVQDIIARIIGQALSERLGQPIVVENRPGAGGTIATEAVVRASPDGYTLLEIATPNAINASLYENLNFTFTSDILPIASIMRVPAVIAINPSVPANSVAELIAYIKANPGKVNMASGGNGTTAHVFGELFKMMTGVDMLHVPYRGSAPAITDLLAGRVHVYFSPLPETIEYIRAGKLHALAVTTSARLEVLPDIPTVADFVPGYEASGWQGIGAPKNTPAAIVEKLNNEINVVLTDPKMKARLADLGGNVFMGSPADFSKFIAGDVEKWAKVVKFAHIKVE
jgi:tripartite-type tricarboxylate transporter receptor subunit TctC